MMVRHDHHLVRFDALERSLLSVGTFCQDSLHTLLLSDGALFTMNLVLYV